MELVVPRASQAQASRQHGRSNFNNFECYKGPGYIHLTTFKFAAIVLAIVVLPTDEATTVRSELYSRKEAVPHSTRLPCLLPRCPGPPVLRSIAPPLPHRRPHASPACALWQTPTCPPPHLSPPPPRALTAHAGLCLSEALGPFWRLCLLLEKEG